MAKEAPFDVWDGEDLDETGAVEAVAAEEVAMHLDPESDINGEDAPHWSELTGETEAITDDRPTTYFPDEQPETEELVRPDDDHEVTLDELLVRQHYSFRR